MFGILFCDYDFPCVGKEVDGGLLINWVAEMAEEVGGAFGEILKLEVSPFKCEALKDSGVSNSHSRWEERCRLSLAVDR